MKIWIFMKGNVILFNIWGIRGCLLGGVKVNLVGEFDRR